MALNLAESPVHGIVPQKDVANSMTKYPSQLTHPAGNSVLSSEVKNDSDGEKSSISGLKCTTNIDYPVLMHQEPSSAQCCSQAGSLQLPSTKARDVIPRQPLLKGSYTVVLSASVDFLLLLLTFQPMKHFHLHSMVDRGLKGINFL